MSKFNFLLDSKGITFQPNRVNSFCAIFAAFTGYDSSRSPHNFTFVILLGLTYFRFNKMVLMPLFFAAIKIFWFSLLALYRSFHERFRQFVT